MIDEIWKPVQGYEDRYLISSWGQVKSLYGKSSRVLKPFVDRYAYVSLWKEKQKRFAIHRLVAQAFINQHESTETLIVNHKNGIKTDNQVDNLEWVTQSENIQHAFKTGLSMIPKGENHYSAKFSEAGIIKIFEAFKLGKLTKQVAEEFNLDIQQIYSLRRGKRWSYLGYSKADLNPKGVPVPYDRASSELLNEVRELVKQRVPRKKIMELTGISKTSLFYKILRQEGLVVRAVKQYS